eukprot:6211194-Pleurochrysis_carterae.AAC.5
MLLPLLSTLPVNHQAQTDGQSGYEPDDHFKKGSPPGRPCDSLDLDARGRTISGLVIFEGGRGTSFAPAPSTRSL